MASHTAYAYEQDEEHEDKVLEKLDALDRPPIGEAGSPIGGPPGYPGAVLWFGPFRWLLIGAAGRSRPPGYPGHLGGFVVSSHHMAWLIAYKGWPGHLQSDPAFPSLQSYLPLS